MATVTDTVVRITSSGVELPQLPADMTPEIALNSFSGVYPELRDCATEVTYENGGTRKVITFTKRTGTKG